MVTICVRYALDEYVCSCVLHKNVSSFWNPVFASVSQTEYVCMALSRCCQVLLLSWHLRLDCVVWIKLQAPGPSLECASDGKPSGMLAAEELSCCSPRKVLVVVMLYRMCFLWMACSFTLCHYP